MCRVLCFVLSIKGKTLATFYVYTHTCSVILNANFFHAYTHTCSVIFTFNYIIIIHLAFFKKLKL